jgi:hypothetical protein
MDDVLAPASSGDSFPSVATSSLQRRKDTHHDPRHYPREHLRSFMYGAVATEIVTKIYARVHLIARPPSVPPRIRGYSIYAISNLLLRCLRSI